MLSKFKYTFFKQLDYMDCGPTCLRMIAAYHGKNYSIDYLRNLSHITRQGVNMLDLSEAAEKINLRATAVQVSFQQVVDEVPLPCILHWNQKHYVVLYDVPENLWDKLLRRQGEDKFIIADPAQGIVTIDSKTFKKCWSGTEEQRGVVLMLEPTADFFVKKDVGQPKTQGFNFLYRYLLQYKTYLVQLTIGILISSLISLLFPFLTQTLVDQGIQKRNFNFINLILFSQLLLFLGNIGIDIIRSWILLHINTRISISIISDFLIKIMRLPISFFDAKNVGDITQRINDHNRIESFLTGSTLATMFSLLNLIVFSFVLAIYSFKIIGVFFVGSLLSIIWVVLFLSKRKDLDYMRFQRMRDNQNSVFELITGMQEIKLNNCERARRWEWEGIQASLFKVKIKSLALEQYQLTGFNFLTQAKNIVISYMAARAVVNNEITLGVMLSISYMVGQMNGPLSQIIQFVRSLQDAKISLERLSEIHNRPNEELTEEYVPEGDTSEMLKGLLAHPGYGDEQQLLNPYLNETLQGIRLSNVSFRYGGPSSPLILNKINLLIPKGKVTAIVGSSGSGKTTLLRLLLKFYPATAGEISVDGKNMNDIQASAWRRICGTVMQDGYIFSDTIAKNIAISGENINEKKLLHAIKVANIHDYIGKLPFGFKTKIGNAGSGLSGGQKQRIFIARAVYKNPQYIFFDEATSSLDANNEKVIMHNLNQFFCNKTVVVIAHRLSTVKEADQIVVMDNGEIKEVGNHDTLLAMKGIYYQLVKNQLQLDLA